MEVRCNYCHRPSAWFMRLNKEQVRVVGTMQRITNKVGEKTQYAHESCLKKFSL
jgi:hypothetical protein